MSTMTTEVVPVQSVPAESPRPHANSSILARVLQTLPTVLTYSLLAGVGWYGHHTGWKMPKLSVLLGAAEEQEKNWCEEHLVPASECVECRKELFARPKSVGFCRKHGVAECVICNPELRQSGKLRMPKYDTVKAIAVMDRPENNSRETLHKKLVQFATEESAAKAGVDIDLVTERPMVDAISANGELVFDPTSVAHLSSRLPGMVAHVYKTAGSDVEAGDVLALVDAVAVGQSKSQLLQSVIRAQLLRKTVERLRKLGSDAVTSKSLNEAEASLQEAEVALLSARQTLVNLGFEVPESLEKHDAKSLADELRMLGIPPAALKELKDGPKTANLIPIVAPHQGVVIQSEVVAGESIDVSKVLFVVADPRRIWLTLNVRQEFSKYLKADLPVEFRPDDESQPITGKITWISPAVDERTRTLSVRVALDDAEKPLRDKTFGSGKIILRKEQHAIVVPRGAIQSTGDANFVFVRDRDYLKEGSPKVFHVRQVRLGASDDGYVELLAGALPGEVIAAKGSAVLLSQLLRSNLGAGCGCCPQ